MSQPTTNARATMTKPITVADLRRMARNIEQSRRKTGAAVAAFLHEALDDPERPTLEVVVDDHRYLSCRAEGATLVVDTEQMLAPWHWASPKSYVEEHLCEPWPRAGKVKP